MPVKGLMLVFWGIVLAALDLRINQVDLLPDPLGYVLAFAGCLAMSRANGAAGPAALAAFLLIFLSIPDVIEHKEILSTNGSVTYYQDRYWVISIFKNLVDLFFVWRLLSVIHELASERSHADLATAALHSRRLYLWMTVAGMSWTAIFWVYPQSLWVAAIPLFIFWVFVILKLLKVISRAHRELADERGFA